METESRRSLQYAEAGGVLTGVLFASVLIGLLIGAVIGIPLATFAVYWRYKDSM